MYIHIVLTRDVETTKRYSYLRLVVFSSDMHLSIYNKCSFINFQVCRSLLTVLGQH